MTLKDVDLIIEKLEDRLKELEVFGMLDCCDYEKGIRFALLVIDGIEPLQPHGDLIDRGKIIQDYRDRMNKAIEWKAQARADEDQEGMIRAEQAEVTFFECGLMMMKAPVIVEANDRDKEEEE